MNRPPPSLGLTFLACFLALGPACGSSPTAAAPPEADALSILFVGNSLTYWNEMPSMLLALLEGRGNEPVAIESYSYPDYGLEDHWLDGRARSRIGQGGWDYVILQQGPSATEGRPSLLEYTQRFDGEIRAAGGVTGVYMVWPSEARFFDFDGVSDSYSRAAELVDGVLFPAGDAWRAAWARDETLSLYGPDRFHPSTLGSFLAAIVIYQKLTGVEARDFPAEIRRGPAATPIDPMLADLLFAAAVEANGS